MKRSELTRRTPLTASPDATRAFITRDQQSTARARKPRTVSPASPAQRLAVRDQSCLVCGGGPVDPAHIIPRSVCPSGADDPRAVIGLCRCCHRDYDDGRLSILEFLEPLFREELAFAVYRFGLISTLEMVTGVRWAPVVPPRLAA